MPARTLDGNQAAAYASYMMTEVASIYPITPSSPMAERVDQWAAEGKKNLFGQAVKVVEMQSEAGAAGAMHGALQAGVLTTTYTASQGLLLMIPNLYKMVGELLPGVLHVSARALATHALSIFGDHQDVMACRQTGAIMLASSSVQEVMDFAFLSHLCALKARLPVIHFFDGFRTSHEYQKIDVPEYGQIRPLVDEQALQAFKNRALNPNQPVARGTAQNPDIYFQGREVQNPFFNRVPAILEDLMQAYGRITGRRYQPFVYHGAPDASHVIVAMGSVCDTTLEVVDRLVAAGEKVGCIRVHLYRPFSISHLLGVLPKTVRCISVLDRTKEPGATGEPLYLDVSKAVAQRDTHTQVLGGRYGLGSKDTRPGHIHAVFDNMRRQNPKNGFTIGIDDDVTMLSLPEQANDDSSETINCKFWGLGSDGTVGANKSAVKIIGDHTDRYVQAYFSYDSKKSGGTTMSHLRFGGRPIRMPYLIDRADYIACHNKSFIYHYDILRGIKPGGIFVLNCDWTKEQLDQHLPGALKRTIAEKKLQFYVVDAIAIASRLGLGNRINMIMQAAFFKLVPVIALDRAVELLKQGIETSYGKKGKKVVEMNCAAVDAGIDALQAVNVPQTWGEEAPPPPRHTDSGDHTPDFIRNIQRVMARDEGDDLPVSAFSGMPDGTFPLGTTAYEKRGIAVMLPEWQIERCIQCGMCSYVCPHATIRMMVLDENEQQRKPEAFETKPAAGKGLEGYQMRIQVSPMDCTGCGNCADVCPAKGKALIMKPAQQQMHQCGNWDFAMTLTEKRHLIAPNTIKGSQLCRPLLEFNGACPGCGETPYVKLVTQLFGERMMIANATGCSSIWGASAPSIAYAANADGKGPAWANSLFEDNAEYGYGMYLGAQQSRSRLAEQVRLALEQPDLAQPLQKALGSWLQAWEAGAVAKEEAEAVIRELSAANAEDCPILKTILQLKDHLVKRSVWIIGGDGWAYDIGYGGLDHVLASGADINVLVLDTEIYSNTGGQASKSTPMAAVAKFAAAGKRTRKKDLGMMAMSYKDVYVAQIAMGANMNQTLQAITEAEKHPGPSLVIAYSPCVSHGIMTGMGTSIAEEKKAVSAGYVHLYRYNPMHRGQGKTPFTLDSKEPAELYRNFLKGELRYAQMMAANPERAEQLIDQAEKHAHIKYAHYKQMAEDPLM